MNRMLFVSVGTSAAENRELKELSPALNDQLGDDEAKTVISRMEDEPEQLKGLEAILLDAHRAFWRANASHIRNPKNFRQTSAEMISTYMAILWGHLPGGLLRAGQDRVIFLATDSAIGEMCARINRELFREYLFLVDNEHAILEIESIKGLGSRATKPDQFTAYPQLRKIAETHLNSKDVITFNISGGYKGLIPALTFLAWRKYPERSTMIYMHESMRATVVLTPAAEGGEFIERTEPWA